MAVTTRRRQDVTTSPQRLTREDMLAQLEAFVDLCFACLPDDDKEVANLSQLSKMTVWRLRKTRFTRCVQFGTIQQLGVAAGLKLTMTEYLVTVRLV